MAPIVPKSLRPSLTAATLAAVLTLTAAPPAAAAPLPAARSSSWLAPGNWLARLWDGVSSIIDPNGDQTAPPPPNEVSSMIDPDGQTAAPPPNEVGSMIDPDG